jgi:hypothetical protein
MKLTPANIVSLKQNEIFVFGSNEAGIHGAGAARVANKSFGAKFGVGFGLVGQTFAIPTKDHMIRTLPLERINNYVIKFAQECKKYPNLNFLVTEIGCGLAGYKPKDIAPMFKNVLAENICLPATFWKVLNT